MHCRARTFDNGQRAIGDQADQERQRNREARGLGFRNRYLWVGKVFRIGLGDRGEGEDGVRPGIRQLP